MAWLQYPSASLAQVASSVEEFGRDVLYASVSAHRKFHEDALSYFYSCDTRGDEIEELITLSGPAASSTDAASLAGRTLFAHLHIARDELPPLPDSTWESGYANAEYIFMAWTRRRGRGTVLTRAKASSLDGQIALFWR